MRVVQGEVFDVAVDIRKGSETFGQWVGASSRREQETDVDSTRFCPRLPALSDTAEFLYKTTDYYSPGPNAASAGMTSTSVLRGRPPARLSLLSKMLRDCIWNALTCSSNEMLFPPKCRKSVLSNRSVITKWPVDSTLPS